MFNIGNLTFYLKSLELEKAELDAIIASSPNAHLKCRKSRHKTAEIYIVNDIDVPGVPREKYVNKNARADAALIFKKMFAEIKTAELARKIDSIRQLINVFSSSPSDQFLIDNPELANLLPKVLSNDDKLLQWKEAPYERNFDYPEQLKYKTVIPGLLVRSKSEADIVSRLEFYGVPYHYDEITYINGVKIALDFVCINASTGKKWFWDHRGMMDDPAYINKTLYCEKQFLQAGYIQGINMIVTSETRNHPLDILEVDNFIKLYLL